MLFGMYNKTLNVLFWCVLQDLEHAVLAHFTKPCIKAKQNGIVKARDAAAI